MEKPKKTYFDHAMERAIKKARFLLEDLKYIRELHKDGRDEVAYGFTLATIESAEEFALKVRQMAISQKIPDSEPEIQRMVDAAYKVELGFTKDGYFCMRFPRLIPGMDGRSMLYLKKNLSVHLEAFWKNRYGMSNYQHLKKVFLLESLLLLICLAAWTIGENTALEVNEYVVQSDRIPEAFSGFRIAQVSDLYNAQFGENNSQLIELLSQTDPDIIVITGDLIDSRQTDIEIAMEFVRLAMKISPVYYVSGNHEARIPEYEDLKMGLVEAGVVILENQKVQITRESESITIIGIDDPSFREDYLFGDAEAVARQAIEDIQNESDDYTILLSHRPELFNIYVDTGMDLVFSGHAHGGQFRLPFIGGLVAPNQGVFPKYDAGLFSEENTTMIVSKGVGNSVIPIRLNNRPEVTITDLYKFKELYLY